MPADTRLQAREALANACAPLGILYPDLPAVSDLSDQATAKRYEVLQDLLLQIRLQGLGAGGRVVVLERARRALGDSPLGRPIPEPAAVSRLLRSALPDSGLAAGPLLPQPTLEAVNRKTFATEAQPLADAIAQSHGEVEDFPGGAA